MKIGHIDGLKAPNGFFGDIKILCDEWYNPPRFFCGALNTNLMLYTIRRYTPDHESWLQSITAATLEAVQAKLGQDWSHVREEVYCSGGAGNSKVPFMMTNYLDQVAVRAHVSIRSGGSFIGPNRTFTYEPGDIFLFTKDDYNQLWRHQYAVVADQVVLSISRDIDRNIRDWDLLRDHERNL